MTKKELIAKMREAVNSRPITPYYSIEKIALLINELEPTKSELLTPYPEGKLVVKYKDESGMNYEKEI